MRKRFGRIAQLLERPPNLGNDPKPLAADERGSDDGCQDHDSEGRPQSDQATDLNKQSDLDQRDKNKDKK